MEKDLVSIIIPVYNVANYIERSVSSLLNQTYKNIEIILVNDGSSDNSSEICNNLINSYKGDNLHLIEQENQGVSSARNVGLKKANGEYIMFVDADDWVDETYVEKLYTAIKDNDADIAFCGFVEWYSNEKQIRYSNTDAIYSLEDYYVKYQMKRPGLWSGIYKNEIIQRNNVHFDVLLRRMEDGCFVSDYIACCSKIVSISDALYYYFQREGSVIHQYRPQTVVGAERDMYILEKLYNSFKRSNANESVYIDLFYKKWAEFMITEAISYTNRRHPIKSDKQRKKILKEIIDKTNIKEKLVLIDKSKVPFKHKIFIDWTKKEKIGLMLTYGKIYNTLRETKRKLRG